MTEPFQPIDRAHRAAASVCAGAFWCEKSRTGRRRRRQRPAHRQCLASLDRGSARACSIGMPELMAPTGELVSAGLPAISGRLISPTSLTPHGGELEGKEGRARREACRRVLRTRMGRHQ